MGRLSEYIWFMNEERMPGKVEIQHRYRYLTITDELKKSRRKYQAELRKRAKKCNKEATELLLTGNNV
jgi:hypothetical protein